MKRNGFLRGFRSSTFVVATAVRLSVPGRRDDLFELLSADEPREQCGRVLMSPSRKVCIIMLILRDELERVETIDLFYTDTVR